MRVELSDVTDTKRKVLVTIEGENVKLWIREERGTIGAEVALSDLERALGMLTAGRGELETSGEE